MALSPERTAAARLIEAEVLGLEVEDLIDDDGHRGHSRCLQKGYATAEAAYQVGVRDGIEAAIREVAEDPGGRSVGPIVDLVAHMEATVAIVRASLQRDMPHTAPEEVRDSQGRYVLLDALTALVNLKAATARG